MLPLTRREMQAILAYSLDMLWFACPGETAQKTCAAVGKRGSRHPDTAAASGRALPRGQAAGEICRLHTDPAIPITGLSYKSTNRCRNGCVCQPEAR